MYVQILHKSEFKDILALVPHKHMYCSYDMRLNLPWSIRKNWHVEIGVTFKPLKIYSRLLEIRVKERLWFKRNLS